MPEKELEKEDRWGRRGPLRPAAGLKDGLLENFTENAFAIPLCMHASLFVSVTQLPASTEVTSVASR